MPSEGMVRVHSLSLMRKHTIGIRPHQGVVYIAQESAALTCNLAGRTARCDAWA